MTLNTRHTLEWLDGIALRVQHIEAELRAALRRLSRTQPGEDSARPGHHTTAAARFGRTVTIGAAEARAILHSIAPAPIAASSLHRQHTRLTIALTHMAGHFVAMNNPLRNPELSLRAAESLITEAREWHRQHAWITATRNARVAGWAPPRLSISTIMQQPTAEHPVNLPSAFAEHHRRTDTAAGYIDTRRAAEAVQLELSLPTAQIIDLRQHRLPLFDQAQAA